MGYQALLSEGKIGDLTLKNRSVMTGMETGVAEFDGRAGERFTQYFAERAKGGVGMIITGICRVNSKHGAAKPYQLSLTDDYYIAPLKEAIDEVHKYGTKFVVQLHHPGRQSLSSLSYFGTIEKMGIKFGDPFWNFVADKFKTMTFEESANPAPTLKFFYKYLASPVRSASDIPCKYGNCIIHDQHTKALSKKQIEELITQFGDAALRAKKAGADAVEIHCAHGYLISQFLSPYTNRRTDEYGGSFENRVRIIKEIVEDIKRKCGNSYPIIIRLNVNDYMETIGFPGQGITIEEGVKLAKYVETLGIQAINVSCGTYETANYSIEPASFKLGFRSEMIKAIKEAVSVPIIAVNVTKTPEQAEKYLQEGLLDFVGLGRALIADPDFIKKAEEGKAQDIQHCICCLRCIESCTAGSLQGIPVECAVNPRACREVDYPKLPPKDGNGRTAVVVGGGPAGLTAAIILGQRGFNTILLEKDKRLGGQLYLATLPPHMERLKWAIEDMEHAAIKAGVEIRLNTAADLDTIKSIKPYAVFDATGGEAIVPPIKGHDRQNVYTTTPVLQGRVKFYNKKVAVIGSGMTGLETAELLASQGNKVTIIEMADKIAPTGYEQHIEDIVPRLKKYGADFMTSEKLSEITNKGIKIENIKTKRKKSIKVDDVVLSLGVKSVGLKFDLPSDIKCIKIGDAAKPGRIYNATHNAYTAAMSLK